jgi:potassium/hydrogen antiporter
VVAVLLFVARPVAVWLSTLFQGFNVRERALLGWAGLRGAVPIVLATYPQAEGLHQSRTIFNAVFFVVVASSLIQGPTLEPVARALGLAGGPRGAYEPPLEVAAVDSLGSGLLEFGVAPDSVVAGRYVRDLELPRNALVAVIVRDGEALPPRGSTQIAAGDRLYVLSRRESRRDVERLFDAWTRF